MAAKKADSVVSGGFEVVGMSIAEYCGLFSSGKVRDDGAYQRDYVPAWGKAEYQARVYDTLTRGWSWGIITANRDSDGVLWLLDGKQRTNYLNRSLAGLTSGPLAWDVETLKKFGDIKIVLCVYNGLTDDESGEIFARLNGGAGLSPMEVRRAELLPLYAHPLVKAAVSALVAVMPAVAGNPPKRSSSEELIALNIWARLGGRDYLAKAAVPGLAAKIKAGGDDYEFAVKAVCDSVMAFTADWAGGLEEGKVSRDAKRILKKGFLNVLFTAYQAGDWLKLMKMSRCTLKGAESTGRGERWAASIQQAAGSVAAVSERLVLVNDAMRGLWCEVEKPGKDGSKDGSKDGGKDGSKDGGKVSPLMAAFIAEYGRGDFQPDEVDKILAYVNGLPSGADPKFVHIKVKAKDGILTVPAVRHLGIKGDIINQRFTAILAK